MLTNVAVNDALYVPDLRTNLMLSVAKITNRRLRVIFDSRSARIIGSNNNKVILSCERKDGLYILHERERDVNRA